MKELRPDYPVFTSTDEDLEVTYGTKGKMVADSKGREYIMAGQFLENEDFYQGLCMITVIRNSDGKLYGFSWWDDISKHGSSYVEPNGDEFGLECDTDVEGFDWDTDYVSYYVFEPVEAYPITAYKKS